MPARNARTLRLGGGTNTRDRKTDVDGGTHTTEEQLSFQEDLTISDGDDLGGNKIFGIEEIRARY
jgi:hypothetical protein